MTGEEHSAPVGGAASLLAKRPEEHAWRMFCDDGHALPIANPVLRLVFGVTMAVGATILILMPVRSQALWWTILFGGMGIAMVLSAVAQLLRRRFLRNELQRARGEWADLVAASVTARESGESLVRLLQRKGYREYFVRQWLAARLQPPT